MSTLLWTKQRTRNHFRSYTLHAGSLSSIQHVEPRVLPLIVCTLPLMGIDVERTHVQIRFHVILFGSDRFLPTATYPALGGKNMCTEQVIAAMRIRTTSGSARVSHQYTQWRCNDIFRTSCDPSPTTNAKAKQTPKTGNLRPRILPHTAISTITSPHPKARQVNHHPRQVAQITLHTPVPPKTRLAFSHI